MAWTGSVAPFRLFQGVFGPILSERDFEMSRERVTVLGVVVLIGVLAYVLVRGLGGEHEPEPDRSPAQEGSKSAAAVHSPASSDRDDERQATLSGKVVDVSGAVVAGAIVCLRESDSPGIEECRTTDAGGGLEFRSIRGGSYRLTAMAEGFRAITHPTQGAIVVAPGAAKHVEIVMKRGRSVEVIGEVADVSGGPISGALVSVVEPPTTVASGGVTDDDGGFRLFANPGPVEIRAVAEGYAFGRVQVTVPTGRMTIALIPESVIAGRVVTPSGEAAVGAHVEIRPETPDRVPFPGRAQTQTTGRGGTFAFHHLQPGHYVVCATSGATFGCAPGTISVAFAEEVEDIEIQLHEARFVEGRVVVAGSEQGCAEGTVRLLEDDTGAEMLGVANDNGSVRIPVPFDGRYGVQVRCAGYASRASYESILVAGEDVRDLRWEVDAGVAIGGRVIDGDSRPIPGAEVIVTARANGDPTATRTAATGEDGTFVVTGLVEGTYGARARASGYAESLEPIEVVAPEDEIVLVLDQGGTIEGTVTTGAGEPVSGMVIVARSTRMTTDGAGTYRIEDAAAGHWTIMLGDRTGWAMLDPATKTGIRKDVDVVAGGTVTADFTVPDHEYEITGTVLSSGAPVESAFVYAIPEPVSGQLPGRILRDQGAIDGAVLTDVDGRFRLAGLQDRNYTVKGFVRDGGEAQRAGVRSGSDITLELEGSTSIAGFVAYSDGRVPSYYRIEAVHAETSTVRTQTYHHSDGRWRFDDMTPGNYHVVAQSRGGRDAVDAVVPESGASGVRLVIDANPDRRVMLVGRVIRLEDSEPLAGFRVVATALDAAVSSQREFSDRRNISGPDGRFALPDPPLGRATVHVIPENLEDQPKDLASAHITVDITAGGGRTSLGDVAIPTRRRVGREPRGDWGFEVIRWNHDGDQIEQPATVASVRPGSQAERLGLKVGDVITEIDEIDVTGNGRYILYFRMDAPVGATSVFGLQRGEHIELRAE